MTTPFPSHPLIEHQLGDGLTLFETSLPDELLPDEAGFEAIWNEHPPEHDQIMIHGRRVPIPRWQEAYGRDYQFSGQTSPAEPMPDWLLPYLQWGQEVIDSRLNGCLLNWYAGDQKHYIGAHRDSVKGLVPGSSIVTISLGEERIFRLSQPKKKLKKDFIAASGTVFVMPLATNEVWYHSVPHFARYTGRRISITIRCFKPDRQS